MKTKWQTKTQKKEQINPKKPQNDLLIDSETLALLQAIEQSRDYFHTCTYTEY
jgi:hypothetical protein